MERIIRLTLEYDGTEFCGWQVNPGVRTVQGVLAEQLALFTGEPELRLVGASRTDAGVHALGQVASFVTRGTIPAHGFLRGLNSRLPADLAIVAAIEAPPGFQARHSARGKRYRYQILNQPVRSPRQARTCWHVPGRLDPDAMARAAQLLVGTHDFSCFRSVGCAAQTPVKTLHRISVEQVPGRPLLTLEVVGDAFLKYMVRNLVGTLLQVGLGRKGEDWVAAALASRDRGKAGPTAPPHGLTLVEVIYEPGAAASA